MWIDEWEWDDGNLEELRAHGLSRRLVLQVAGNASRFRRNKRGRAASHQMVGPDAGGTMWVICIAEAAAEPGRWRAITGWRAEEPDIDWYRRAAR